MEVAFDSLKLTLTTALVLAYPEFEKPFFEANAASSKAVGAVLSQLDQSGRENLIHYSSRGLSSAERIYSTYERRGLAIVFALKMFGHYLLCRKFKLFADHEAL